MAVNKINLEYPAQQTLLLSVLGIVGKLELSTMTKTDVCRKFQFYISVGLDMNWPNLSEPQRKRSGRICDRQLKNRHVWDVEWIKNVQKARLLDEIFHTKTRE